MTPWELPETATIGGTVYELHTDFRDILEIMKYLNDPDQPEFMRWRIAIALFYDGEIPQEHHQEAINYLSAFISCGEIEHKPGPKLLDWEHDALAIVADVNKVAGTEIRKMQHLHWWTFMSFFQAIGEGQLSTLVSIRDKLHKGKKLEEWEKSFYRENKQRVDLPKRYTQEELQEQERIKRMLGE